MPIAKDSLVSLRGVPQIPIKPSLLGEDTVEYLSSEQLEKCDAAIAAGKAEIRQRHLERLRNLTDSSVASTVRSRLKSQQKRRDALVAAVTLSDLGSQADDFGDEEELD